MSKALTDGIGKVIATVVAGVFLFFIVDVFLKSRYDDKDQKRYDRIILRAEEKYRATPPDFEGALAYYRKGKEIAYDNGLSDKKAIDGIKKCQAKLNSDPPENKPQYADNDEKNPVEKEKTEPASRKNEEDVGPKNEFRNYTETADNLNIKMIAVKGGSFMMGSNDGGKDEKPVHKVTVPDFYIGKYEVTVKEFNAYLKDTGVKVKDGSKNNHPVTNVNWREARAYCKWLSKKTGIDYRLPTEAEWEFAARGGVKSEGFEYAGSQDLAMVGWYWENSGKTTHPVGDLDPNELGIYDMSGNVWEWCLDKWHDDYTDAPDDGTAWVYGDSSYRMIRGGSWYYTASRCRVSNRSNNSPDFRSSNIGFRLAHSSS